MPALLPPPSKPEISLSSSSGTIRNKHDKSLTLVTALAASAAIISTVLIAIFIISSGTQSDVSEKTKKMDLNNDKPLLPQVPQVLNPKEILKQIALRGRMYATTSEVAGDDEFIDVFVETCESNSLTYPLVGRIKAGWKTEYLDDWIAIYYKWDGVNWNFVKYSRLSNIQSFQPLSAEHALAPSPRPEFNNPMPEGIAQKFTIWLP
jgi:hypothetical protein